MLTVIGILVIAILFMNFIMTILFFAAALAAIKEENKKED